MTVRSWAVVILEPSLDKGPVMHFVTKLVRTMREFGMWSFVMWTKALTILLFNYRNEYVRHLNRHRRITDVVLQLSLRRNPESYICLIWMGSKRYGWCSIDKSTCFICVIQELTAPPKFLLAILPDYGFSVKKDVKQFGDIMHGVPTQCVVRSFRTTFCGAL